MFGKRFVLFELLGFKVQADASWLLLALLVTWSLAEGFFPSFYGGLAYTAYWWMGIAGAIGLFASLVLHELAHSLVARHYGLRIKGITLFIFGGVAEMEEEPANAKVEFRMAIAGPGASLALTALFYLISVFAEAMALPVTVLGVSRYLTVINGMLAAFNLVPAFPLDGGRAFRALLWQWKGDLRWATRLASRIGEFFGFGLIFLGVLNVLNGNFIAGMWWFLIGLFLRGAAGASYQQMMMRRAFEGEPVSRFMTVDPVTVPPYVSVADLVENYFYRYHYDLFPVTEGSRVIGLVSLREVKQVAREDWDRRSVAELLQPCSRDNTVTPQTDAVQALTIMRRAGNSRLLVAEGSRLVGVIALKDLLEFFGLKMDLERLG